MTGTGVTALETPVSEGGSAEELANRILATLEARASGRVPQP